MRNSFKNFLAKLLLALSLAGVAGAATAGPIYKVNIDTSSLGSGTAYLGLYLLGLTDSAPATATVTGLTGSFAGPAMLTGSVSGGGLDPLVFTNANGGGDYVQAINLGGTFLFDVSFAMSPGPVGTTFGWALFNDVQYLGADGDLGNIFLTPSAPLSQQLSLVTAQSAVGAVTVVPEPSSVALMLLAGLLLAAALRRRA